MGMIQPINYRLSPPDGQKPITDYRYSRKFLETTVQTDLNPDKVLSSFTEIIDRINQDPSKIRDLLKITKGLAFLLVHLLHSQALFNVDLLNFVNNHQHEMTMTTK